MICNAYSQSLKNRLGLITVGMAVMAYGTLGHMQSADANASGQLHGRTTAFNSILKQKVSTLNDTLPDARVALLDVNTLFSDVLPGEFAEPVQSCVQLLIRLALSQTLQTIRLSQLTILTQPLMTCMC